MTSTPTQSWFESRPKWLLIASLALNLLVLGVAAGMAFNHHRGPGNGDFNLWRLVNSDQGLRGFVRTLPAERQPMFRVLIDEMRPTLKPKRQAVLEARSAVLGALGQEPFDAQKLTATIEALGAAEAIGRQGVSTTLAKALTAMTPDERSAFAAWRKKHDLFHAHGRPEDGRHN